MNFNWFLPMAMNKKGSISLHAKITKRSRNSSKLFQSVFYANGPNIEDISFKKQKTLKEMND